MAGPLALYAGPASVFFGARLLAEASGIHVVVAGNNTPVKTMQRGLAGRSRGAGGSEATVANAIPVAGLEADFYGKCVRNENVRLVYVQDGKRIQLDGWIEDVTSD